MNILGFNPSHHGSVCLLQDGELKYFIQEERVGNREKYRGIPFKGFIDILENYKIDWITFATPSIGYPINWFEPSYYKPPYWFAIAESYYPNVEFKDYSSTHHLSHAAHTFYNSGFKESITLIIDGLGSMMSNLDKDLGRETESVFICKYPSFFKILHKNICTAGLKIKDKDIDNFTKNNKSLFNFTEQINLSRVYETVTMHLGWSRNEAGKTMGLAPYGKFNKNLPIFFNNKNGNSKVFYRDLDEKRNDYYNETFINEHLNPQLKLKKDPKEWHYDESKITNLEKDLAWKIQNDTQRIVGDYIEEAIEKTGIKQVCCAGGYFLNCVTNYYLQKRFSNIEFYFEPIANDSGTAIGSAKLLWHSLTQDTTIRPFKSLYLGKQYSKKKLLKGIKKYT